MAHRTQIAKRRMAAYGQRQLQGRELQREKRRLVAKQEKLRLKAWQLQQLAETLEKIATS